MVCIELAFYNIFKWSDKKRIIPYQYSIFKKVSLDLWDRILSNLAFEDIKRFSLTSHYANEIVHLYCRQKYQRIIYSKRPAILYNISKANLVHSSYHTGLNLNSIKSTEFDIFEIFQSCLNNNSIYYIDLFEKFSCKKNLSTSFSNLLMNNYQHRSSDNVQYLNKSTYPNFYQTNQFSKFYGDILKESIRELLAFYNNDDDRNNIYNTIHFLINMSKDEGAKDNVHMNFNTTENILTMEIEKEDEINPETIEMPLPNSEDIVIPKIFRTFNLLIQNSCPFVNEGFIYQMFIPSQFCPTSDISFHALHDENYFKLILQCHIAKVINEIRKTHSKSEVSEINNENNNDENNNDGNDNNENDNNENNNNENNNNENNTVENNNDNHNNNSVVNNENDMNTEDKLVQYINPDENLSFILEKYYSQFKTIINVIEKRNSYTIDYHKIKSFSVDLDKFLNLINNPGYYTWKIIAKSCHNLTHLTLSFSVRLIILKSFFINNPNLEAVVIQDIKVKSHSSTNNISNTKWDKQIQEKEEKNNFSSFPILSNLKSLILHSSYTYHLWFNISDFNGWLKQLPNLQELKLFIIEPIPKYFYNIHNVIKDCSSLENLIVSGPWFNDKCIKTLIENETNNKNKERHHLKSLTISLNDDVEPHNIKNLICKTNLEKLELNIPQNFDIKKLYNSNMNINFSSLKKNKSTYCFNINDLELIKQSI